MYIVEDAKIRTTNSEIRSIAQRSRQDYPTRGREQGGGREEVKDGYNFCTMSNLSLKPIDSFFGSYFLRAASWARSSLALIFRFKLCRGSLVTFPFPVPCTCAIVVSFLMPFPFSRSAPSRSLSFSFPFSLLFEVVLLSLCEVSFEPLDFCAFWKIQANYYLFFLSTSIICAFLLATVIPCARRDEEEWRRTRQTGGGEGGGKKKRQINDRRQKEFVSHIKADRIASRYFFSPKYICKYVCATTK